MSSGCDTGTRYLVRVYDNPFCDPNVRLPQTVLTGYRQGLPVSHPPRWSKLGNVWEGVSASFIVEHVRPRPEATFVLQHADPDYTTNTALADLLADDAVLARKHNGKDLEPDHGGPMRLVLPRLYFWKSF